MEQWPVTYWYGDVAFGVMTVLLWAVDAGLGACILGSEETLAETLGVPDGWHLFGGVVLGRPDGKDHRSGSLDRRDRADPPWRVVVRRRGRLRLLLVALEMARILGPGMCCRDRHHAVARAT